MNTLFRELAPVTEAAWSEIDQEARRTLRLTLAARKLTDFVGPLGWRQSAVDLVRTRDVAAPGEGVEAKLRLVQPLVEIRVPFRLRRAEVDAISRGSKDADLRPVVDAAQSAALAEDRAVFHGFPGADIQGIGQAAEASGLGLTEDYVKYPSVVAAALSRLRDAGIAGPYGIALGPRCYRGLSETTVGGFPIYDHVRRMLDGPVVWAPAVDGAVVLSLRGGDFELTVGQDLSIGYLDHDRTDIDLYIQESFTFRVLAGEAAVPLTYRSAGRESA